MPVVVLFIIFVVLLVIAVPVSITLGITSVLPSVFDPSFTVGANKFPNILKKIMSIAIGIKNRIINAICLLIGLQNSFQKYTIHVDKARKCCIIVPTPEIVQPRLLIKHIPAIPKRLHLAQRFRQLAGTPQRHAPRIVAVADDGIAILIQNCNNIALQVLDVSIRRAVVHHHRRTILCIVEEVQFIRAGSHMHNFLPMQAAARCSRHAALS